MQVLLFTFKYQRLDSLRFGLSEPSDFQVVLDVELGKENNLLFGKAQAAFW